MCDAHIRPFRPINDVELTCKVDLPANHPLHDGDFVDYAYPGSSTTITWAEHDRRNFHGEWPGQCVNSSECNLPNGHHGRCNVD